MVFWFYTPNGKRMYSRQDAIEAQHFCEDYAMEAAFPLRADRPLSVGMLIAWQDEDGLWEVHELTTVEPDAYGDKVEVSGRHIAVTELQATIRKAVKHEDATLPTIMAEVLAGTGWNVGEITTAAGTETRPLYKVSTSSSRLNLRSGPGGSYRSLGLYKKGTIVALLDKTSSAWYKVETPDGRVGWMSADYLSIAGSTTPNGGEPVTMDEAWVSAWSALATAAEAAKLLIVPRVDVDDTGIIGRWLDVRTIAPEYRGVRLSCNVNIRQAGVKYDISNLCTALIGLGKEDKTFSDAVWKTADGDPADKPKGQYYVEDPAARAVWGKSRVGIVRFEDVSKAETLLKKTWEQLRIASVPALTIDATIADLYRMGYGGQAMRLYDMVYIDLEPLSMRIAARIQGLTRDLVKPEDTKPVIGTLSADMVSDIYAGRDLASNINGWQIHSVGGGVINDGSIPYAKFQTAAIEQLSANAITALTARIGEIAADKIITDELYTAYADMIRLAADSISAGQIDADRLAANLAEIVNLSVQTGQFDMATIKQLLANALILQDGVAGSMMITNLAITSANMLNATIGELVLKGDDGGYYRVFVGADGVISTEAATVTDGEIAAGQTSAGNQIVETTANIGALNAQDIKAQSAIIASIFTEALTAGKITAAEAMLASATIPALYVDTIKAIGDTIDISANSSITLGVGGAGLSKLLRLDERGVHVGVYGSGNELLLDEMSVNVMMNNQRYSRFAANYVQFGNYQLRKSADGGLVFKLKEG